MRKCLKKLQKTKKYFEDSLFESPLFCTEKVCAKWRKEKTKKMTKSAFLFSYIIEKRMRSD